MNERSCPPLDISPLVNAVAGLREGLERHRKEPNDEQLRDGLIQARAIATALAMTATLDVRNEHAAILRQMRAV